MKTNIKIIKAFVCNGDLGIINVFEAELRAEMAFADWTRPEGIAVMMKLKEILGETP